MVATPMNLRPSLETIVPGNTIDQRAALNRDTEDAPLCTTILASTACVGSEDTLSLTPPTTPRTTSASSTAASAPDATSMVANPMNLRPSLETIVPGSTIDQRAALNYDTEDAPLCTTILGNTACVCSEDTLCLTQSTTSRTTSASSTAASPPNTTSRVASLMNLRRSLATIVPGNTIDQ